MPEISRFFGIVIKMFFSDHLPPHFHVEYGEYKTVIEIENGKIIKGKLPKKQIKLIQAWTIIHQKELLDNFKNLRNKPDKWKKIDPLK